MEEPDRLLQAFWKMNEEVFATKKSEIPFDGIEEIVKEILRLGFFILPVQKPWGFLLYFDYPSSPKPHIRFVTLKCTQNAQTDNADMQVVYNRLNELMEKLFVYFQTPEIIGVVAMSEYGAVALRAVVDEEKEVFLRGCATLSE